MSFETVSEEVIRQERARAREIRQSAWWRNQIGKGQCYYCHERVHPNDLTMDHKTPIARGGRSTRHNIVPCCKVCNTDKKYLTLSEWIAQREDEGRSLACAAHLLN
ncbi:MAG: HNH endonuclease [Acidobacteria bacterium]|nr:HNH endonuclease [Acidobacteriota bacterium]